MTGVLTHPRGGNTCWQTNTIELGSKSSWHTNRQADNRQMSPNFHTVETSDKWLGCWLWQHDKSGRLRYPRGGNTCWQTSTVELGGKSSWHTNRHEPKHRTNKQINSQRVHFECYGCSLYPYPLLTGLVSSPVEKTTNQGKWTGNLHQANHTDNMGNTKLI